MYSLEATLLALSVAVTTSLCTPSLRASAWSVYVPLAVHGPVEQEAPDTLLSAPPSIETAIDFTPELGFPSGPSSLAETESVCGTALTSARAGHPIVRVCPAACHQP